jgi:serine O-acetyltransferase
MKEEIFIEQLFANRHRLTYFPNKQKSEQFIDHLYQLLFICRTLNELSSTELKTLYTRLELQFEEILFETLNDKQKAVTEAETFFNQLPEIYNQLLQDAEAILQNDPAARNITEVMAAYPGFYATVVHRFAHQLWQQSIPLLPRLLTEYAHSKTGIDIHPGATIGASFSIDHGTGVVIGETTLIGNNVKIYQGVTLGALSVAKEEASKKRHPTIEDDVVIYAGATILGGETVVGANSIIGGNVWLTYSIPPRSVVYHKSEVKVKDKDPFTEPLNFVI